MTSTPSNFSNSPVHRSSLQVVPPTKLQPTKPTVDSTPNSPPVAPESSASPRKLGWPVMGVVIIGLGYLGFLPVPQSVTGSSEITSTPKARQTVTMPMSGRVEMLVRSNQNVEINQAIARIKSEDLNKDIAETTSHFDQAHADVALSQQQLDPIRAQFNETLAKVKGSHQKTEFLQQQLTQMNQGNPPPQIQELSSQQAGIRSEIIGLQSNLDLVEKRLSLYQPAVQAGAISRSTLEEVQRQKNTFQQQIREKNYQVEAKAAQIATVKQNLQQQLKEQQASEDQIVAAMNSAMQQVKQAAANVQIRQQVATKRETELARQHNRQQDSVLKAETAGTVVTANLDQLHNQYLQGGSKVLEIVDLKQLTATVQIPPEDAPLVKTGATVTFRPQGTGLLSYQGTVQQPADIDSVVPSDGVQHPPTVTVRVILSGQDNLLRPGLKGYAHIEGESLLLYQKLQREFVKLVPVGKFF